MKPPLIRPTGVRAARAETHLRRLAALALFAGFAASVSAQSTTVDNTVTPTLGAFDTTANNLTLSGTATGLASGVISGSGSLTKSDSGTWTLSANNTFSGSTTISGGTLGLSGSGSLANSAVIIDSGATLLANKVNFFDPDFAIGGLSGAGAVSLSSSAQLIFGANNADTTFSGNLSGNGSLSKTGTGTLTFAGTNSGSAQLLATGGTIVFSPSTSATYSGTVNASSGATIIVAPPDPSKFTGVLAAQPGGNLTISLPNSTPLAASSIFFNNGGTLTLDGFASTALSTTRLDLNSGGVTLNVSSGTVIGGLNGSGATLRFSEQYGRLDLTVGANNLDSSLGNLSLQNTYSSPFASPSLSLTKIGTGTLTLGSAANFMPVVQAGYVAVSETNSVGLQGGGLRYSQDMTHSGSIYVMTGGTIDTGSYNVTFAGGLDGNPNTPILTKIGSGTLTISGSNNFSGTLAIDGGALSVSASEKIGLDYPEYGAVSHVAFGGGTLKTTASFTSTHPVTLNSGGGTFEVAGNTTLTWNGNITGSSNNTLTKTGSGTLSLGGADTYTGATTISSGTLSGNTASLPGPITVTANATLTFVQSSNGTFSNQISGGGDVSKTGFGALTLTGNQTFTGNLTINDGAIIGNTTSLNSRIAVTGNGTLTFDQASNGSYGNIISGSGAFIKTGAGALTFTGNQTFSGSTSINAGTLIIGSSGSLGNTTLSIADGATLAGSGTIGGPTTFHSGAHLAPGNSPGTLTFTNGLTLTEGAILDFQLGTTSDLIRVNHGTLTGPGVDGGVVINLSDAGGFDTLGEGVVYTVINFSGATPASFTTTYFTLGNVIPGTSASNYAFGSTGSALTLTYSYSASAIPEPATYAALFGVCALGLATWRRRRLA